MVAHIEQTFVKRYVIKAKQERYLTFLSKEKSRHKFISELYHFNDFNWKLFREIPGSENERQTVSLRVNRLRNISSCYIISTDNEFDGKLVSIDEAIKRAFGTQGTILIFGDADIVYYEGEAPNNRYVSI